MGWVLSSLGRPEEGITRLQAVAERLEASSPTPGLVALYATLVHLFLRRGRRRDLAVAAERAAELAQTVGDERMRAQAELSRAFALSDDHVDEALALFEDVIVTAGKAGDSETLARALLAAGWIYAARGEFERSRTYLEQNVDLHQRTSNWKWLADALRSRGELLVIQGDWVGARENYERAAGMTLALTLPIAAWVRLSLAQLCLLEGKWQDADVFLDECAESVERSGDRSSVPQLHALLAARDLWNGQADEAVARLDPLRSQFDLGHDELMILAEAHLAMGNATRAAEVVTSGAERAAAQNNRLAGADWRRLRGMLLAEYG
jgi:tetratricopeptide (TPR) repeat protein